MVMQCSSGMTVQGHLQNKGSMISHVNYQSGEHDFQELGEPVV